MRARVIVVIVVIVVLAIVVVGLNRRVDAGVVDDGGEVVADNLVAAVRVFTIDIAVVFHITNLIVVLVVDVVVIVFVVVIVIVCCCCCFSQIN